MVGPFPSLSIASQGRYITPLVIGMDCILSTTSQHAFESEDFRCIITKPKSRQQAITTITLNNTMAAKVKQSFSDIRSAKNVWQVIDSTTFRVLQNVF